jgi:hypothetical protein
MPRTSSKTNPQMEIIQQIISEWKIADQSTRQQALEFLRASSRGEVEAKCSALSIIRADIALPLTYDPRLRAK